MMVYDGATTPRQAGELTEIKSSMPIKGCDCNGSLIVMWSGRKAEVHTIDLDTGASVCERERARARASENESESERESERETLLVSECDWGRDEDGYAAKDDGRRLAGCCGGWSARVVLLERACCSWCLLASFCRGLVMCWFAGSGDQRWARRVGSSSVAMHARLPVSLWACECFERERGAARRCCQPCAHGHTWCLGGLPSPAAAGRSARGMIRGIVAHAACWLMPRASPFAIPSHPCVSSRARDGDQTRGADVG